jgi:RecA-family ATPase
VTNSLEKVPQELKARPQWVSWKLEPGKDNKITKVPYRPQNPRWKASSTNSETWGTFEQAQGAVKINGIAGIGFVFSPKDELTGIDLDHARKFKMAEIFPWAREIIRRFDSYTEESPSGTGFHIWVKGKLPPGEGNQKNLPDGGKIEVYDVGRYFTVTGNHLEGTPATIKERDKELKAFHAEVIAKPKTPPKTPGPTPALNMADSEIIAKFQSADNVTKFNRLMAGDTSEYGGDDSRADLALCALIGFYTQDPVQIDRIFRTSRLYRDKWDSRRGDSTYGANTIQKALNDLTEIYQGSYQSKPKDRPQERKEKTAGLDSDPEQDYDRLEREAIQSEPEPEKPKLLGGILELNELASIVVPERKKYLDPWLMESSINMICAPRGTGKTMLGVSVAGAAARGASFGPWGAGESVNVLYLDGELVLSDLQERANYFRQDSYPSKFYVYSTHQFNLLGLPNANLSDETWQKEMTDLLKYLNVKLWFIDNIASLTPGIDENLKHAWDPINQWFLQLRFAGISTVFLHHTGKEKAQRGTSGREDNIDISIMLEFPKGYHKEDGCRFVAKFEKARIRQRDLHLIADTEFALEVDEDNVHTWTYKNVKLGNKKTILEMLDQGMTQKDVAETLSLDKGYVSRIKTQAEKDGYLSANGKLTQTGYVFAHSS